MGGESQKGGEWELKKKKQKQRGKRRRDSVFVFLLLAGESDNKTVNITIQKLLSSSFESYPSKVTKSFIINCQLTDAGLCHRSSEEVRSMWIEAAQGP